ncbi:U32 family peptidase [Pseudohaliea rubra]|uniref:Ubiquinone biosynthesis protein UbiV n=1 Tax=Pseudohaliea rubra DSM 19751 TaxID=1265313 RepID=A0A095VUT1_9GAMM|nr:U32 family peptidase [Pseudohaliea rubra]KGE04838.1 putative protease [Pseudohaliea rubra DSM 19751]
MRLSLGPLLYPWSREAIEAFYAERVADPVDIVYLGETVCAKRRSLAPDEWLALGRELAAAGKQVVLSTLALVQAGSELSTVRRLCRNGEFLVEANDMGAVRLLAEEGLPFVGGASLNLYNVAALRLLRDRGMVRWLPPLELSRESLGDLLGEARRAGVVLETELFAFGRIPLACSARCFTARHVGRPKDRCAIVCEDYPEGLPMASQEGEPLFTLNGVQTQSGAVQHLLPYGRELADLGVTTLRLSPQPEHLGAVIDRYRAVLDGASDSTDVTAWVSAPVCDGFFRGAPGMAVAPNA